MCAWVSPECCPLCLSSLLWVCVCGCVGCTTAAAAAAPLARLSRLPLSHVQRLYSFWSLPPPAVSRSASWSTLRLSHSQTRGFLYSRSYPAALHARPRLFICTLDPSASSYPSSSPSPPSHTLHLHPRSRSASSSSHKQSRDNFNCQLCLSTASNSLCSLQVPSSNLLSSSLSLIPPSHCQDCQFVVIRLVFIRKIFHLQSFYNYLLLLEQHFSFN